MKIFIPFLLVSVLLLTGCDSMSSSMPDRFSPVLPKVQVFAGEQAEVKTAVMQAFKRLDFMVTRSKGMDVEAVSRINTSVAFADSRQLVAAVHLNDAGPGKTEVELTLTEQFQSESVGGTSQQKLREHSFFQLYFATLQQVIDEEAAWKASQKN